MAAGNRSVLVIMDSRRRVQRSQADQTVFAALDHFGILWEVLECADYMQRPPNHLAPRAAYVIAHDGAGAGLSDEDANAIARQVQEGAGLVSFDREIARWPSGLRDMLPQAVASVETSRLEFCAPEGFITHGHPKDKQLELEQPLTVTTCPGEGPWEPLVVSESGDCVIARAQVGEGRAVVFGVGERLYAEGIFGHVRGVDGLMWRSLVWAAAKPFPMRCIPPLVTARMDDCNGTYSAFGYVEAMNRHGIRPNLGLFIDEMGPSDKAAARRLFERGGADFSMHAFRDDFYMTRADYKPFAVLPDKPDLSQGGTVSVFEGLSLDHVTGRELDVATVSRNFERMDAAFAEMGIRHSSVINAHFGEIGWRAVRGFLERGVDMPCNNSVIGQLYGNQPSWRPGPYGIRSASGRYGLVLQHCPRNSGLTFIAMSVAHVRTHMGSDILSGRVPFLGESEKPKLDEAAEQGITNVKLALDALAYGPIMTHEERINAISPEDWDSVIEGIVRGLAGWDVEFGGREEVGITCKRLLNSRLFYADLRDGVVHCELYGRTDGPSPLTVWDNEGDGCVRRKVEVPQLDGCVELVVG